MIARCLPKQIYKEGLWSKQVGRMLSGGDRLVSMDRCEHRVTRREVEMKKAFKIKFPSSLHSFEEPLTDSSLFLLAFQSDIERCQHKMACWAHV